MHTVQVATTSNFPSNPFRFKIHYRALCMIICYYVARRIFCDGERVVLELFTLQDKGMSLKFPFIFTESNRPS